MEYNLRGNFKLANESERLVCELNRSRLSSIFLHLGWLSQLQKSLPMCGLCGRFVLLRRYRI